VIFDCLANQRLRLDAADLATHPCVAGTSELIRGSLGICLPNPGDIVIKPDIVMVGADQRRSIFGKTDTSNLQKSCYTQRFTALKKHREEE